MTPGALEAKEALQTGLETWAEEHAAHSGGVLVKLPHDPGKYPGQEGVNVLGDPQPAAVVDTIAETAQPKYKEMTERLAEQEAATNEVSRMGELLKGGNNVILVTNHGDLIDIAVTQTAFYSLLDQMGYEPKTGIIISKMVSYLAYMLGDKPAPTVEVLKMLETETFLSVPRTKSAEKKGLSRLRFDEADRQNKQMRDRIEQLLGRGGVLLGLAASGTTDKSDPEGDPDVLLMEGITPGTYNIVKGERNYRVPVAVWYQGSEVVFDICDIPKVTGTNEEADESMELIAKRLTERVPGKKFVYNQPAVSR